MAVVLDMDRVKSIIDLSLSARLCGDGAKEGKKKRSLPKEGDAAHAQVELVKDKYLVVSFPDHGSRLG